MPYLVVAALGFAAGICLQQTRADTGSVLFTPSVVARTESEKKIVQEANEKLHDYEIQLDAILEDQKKAMAKFEAIREWITLGKAGSN